MVVNSLTVLMDGVVAGTIERNRDRLRLRYDEGYRARSSATPLSLSLPLEFAEHGHAPVDAFLWGLLPDSPAVLARWARQFQVSPGNAFSLLSTPVGEDCAGAVQLARPDRLPALRGSEPDVEWLDEAGVADRIRTLRGDESAWLGTGRTTGQFSLAGAQPKTALHHQAGKWGVPHGRTPTTHILKPAIPGLWEHEVNEHLCLSAARLAGLTAAESRVERFEDQSVVVVTRFDRVQMDGRIRRVHQEDLCQAVGLPPGMKYQADGGPSPKMIAQLLRKNLSVERAADAVSAFLDALAFNWLIAGTDAHAKNYALLLSGRQVRFAPLYDVASALLVEPDPLQLKLAMKIGGEYRLKNLTRRNWQKAAAEWKLNEEETLGRIVDLAERLPDAFADAAADPTVRELGSDVPSRLTDLVSARVRDCLRALVA